MGKSPQGKSPAWQVWYSGIGKKLCHLSRDVTIQRHNPFLHGK